MFLLGHLGITLGVIFFFSGRHAPKPVLDYRLIIVLAMLPDIIDKVLGHVVFRDNLDNGRLVARNRW